MMTADQLRVLDKELDALFELFPYIVLLRWQDGQFEFITFGGPANGSWCEASFSKESEEYRVIDELISLWRRTRRGNFYMRYNRRGEN